MSRNYDANMKMSVLKNINMSVPWYLMACAAYYLDDDPILLDSTYDELSRTMVERWDDIQHFHKHYLTLNMVSAQTYLGAYPPRVIQALKSLRNSL